MRILLVDDHELVREAIALVLHKEPDTEVQTARDVASALNRLRQDNGFDIILLDYNMPGMQGLAGLAAVRAVAPGVPVALLSGSIPKAAVEQALSEGAAGYLPKSLSTRALVAALRVMVAGRVFAPIRLDPTPGADGTPPLTPREEDVLRGLCRSQSNKSIARDLALQEVTVKLHLRTLFRKLGARNRTHAVLLALNLGLA